MLWDRSSPPPRQCCSAHWLTARSELLWGRSFAVQPSSHARSRAFLNPSAQEAIGRTRRGSLTRVPTCREGKRLPSGGSGLKIHCSPEHIRHRFRWARGTHRRPTQSVRPAPAGLGIWFLAGDQSNGSSGNQTKCIGRLNPSCCTQETTDPLGRAEPIERDDDDNRGGRGRKQGAKIEGNPSSSLWSSAPPTQPPRAQTMEVLADARQSHRSLLLMTPS